MKDKQGPINKDDKKDREQQINALLEGELDHAESEALKSAADNDQELARDIIEAYQLQRAMESLQLDKAPASLRRRLKKIPQQNRPLFFQPRWGMAFAVVPLVIMTVFMLRSPGPLTGQPAETEWVKLEQARQDLAVAFAYIGQVSDRTSSLIEAELGGEMTDAVAGSIFKTIQHQNLL